MDITAKVEKLPKLGETIMGYDCYKSCGGKGANQAVALSKLDMNTKMIGCVGFDSDGDELIENLIKNKVEPIIIKSNKVTGKAIITVDNNGDNNIIVIPGANFEIKKDDIDEKIDFIKETDIVILQNEIPIDVTNYVLKKAKENNKKTIFNPAPAVKLSNEIFKNIDYLILNETEFEYIFETNYEDSEKVLNIKKENSINNLIITLGEKGVRVVNEKFKLIDIPAYKVKAVDTTAAGDSFIGAFASCITKGQSLEESIKFAIAVSAIVVTKNGAQESIPAYEETKRFIESMCI